MTDDKMHWLFAGKSGQKRVGKDYNYKCSACGHIVFVEELGSSESLPKACGGCKRRDSDQC